MKEIDPSEILTEGRKGGRSIDKEPLIDSSERTLETPLLPSNLPQQDSGKRERRIDEEDTVSLVQSHDQKLLPLDHTIPSINSIIDDIGWNFIHEGIVARFCIRLFTKKALSSWSRRGSLEPLILRPLES